MTLDHQPITAILDETIAALSRFDGARLEVLEQQISTLSRSSFACSSAGVDAILERRRVLESLLRNCDANLNALRRLHPRDRMDPWLR